MSNISLATSRKDTALLKNISLLPPEIKAQRQIRRRRTLYFLGSSLVLLIFLGINAALTVGAVQVRAEARALQERRAELGKEVSAYKPYADMQASLTKADKIARQAMGTPPDYKVIMAGIGLYIPEGVWLTDFTASYKTDEKGKSQVKAGQTDSTTVPAQPAAGELMVRGWTSSHPKVARWLEDIRSVPGLTDVSCQFSSEEELNGLPMIKFEIKATVLAGAPYQPAAGMGE